MLRWLVPILLVGAALVGALLWSQRQTGPFEVSGFLESDSIRVGSRVGGRILAVHVAEGDAVEKGQLLVELEPFDLLSRKAEAEAMLARAKAELEQRENGFRKEEIDQAVARVARLEAVVAEAEAGPRPQEIEVARAELRRAEASRELARVEIRRVQRLLEKQATTADEADRAERELRTSEESVNAAREKVELLEEGTRKEEIAQAKAQLAEARAALALVQSGSRAEEIAQARASVAAAAAAVTTLEERVAELKVVAPLAGTIEALRLRRGDLVAPNAPVLTILDPARLWVRAYVPENRVSFALGTRVEVRVDAFPDRAFPGDVTFIARQAEFVPGNVQTPEERAKQVFRITVDLREGLDVLRSGMPADVRFP